MLIIVHRFGCSAIDASHLLLAMQKGLHPELKQTDVYCGCGNEFTIYSTEERMKVEICSECHPFYTGQQKYVDSEGRVEKFQDKYDWSEERVSELVGDES